MATNRKQGNSYSHNDCTIFRIEIYTIDRCIYFKRQRNFTKKNVTALTESQVGPGVFNKMWIESNEAANDLLSKRAKIPLHGSKKLSGYEKGFTIFRKEKKQLKNHIDESTRYETVQGVCRKIRIKERLESFEPYQEEP